MQELAIEQWRTSVESTESNDNIPVLWGKLDKASMTIKWNPVMLREFVSAITV